MDKHSNPAPDKQRLPQPGPVKPKRFRYSDWACL